MWRGSARQVVVSLRRNNSYATVNRVAVYSNSSSSGYGDSGNNSYSVSTPYAPITRLVPTNEELNMTVVSISSLGANSTYTRPADGSVNGSTATSQSYLIADPREVSGWNSSDLVPYWSGTYNNGSAVAWDDDIVREIRIGTTSVPNLIAPKVLVSSRWGRTVDWGSDARNATTYLVDFETAQKRCATYQEAGYPAGRWRLPTEAEIIFMAQLQSNGLISTLYSGGGYNATASGTIIGVNNNTVSYWSTNHTLNSMRCVYDLWYWGDAPVDGAASKYTIAVQ
jgi:hypothetical protein